MADFLYSPSLHPGSIATAILRHCMCQHRWAALSSKRIFLNQTDIIWIKRQKYPIALIFLTGLSDTLSFISNVSPRDGILKILIFKKKKSWFFLTFRSTRILCLLPALWIGLNKKNQNYLKFLKSFKHSWVSNFQANLPEQATINGSSKLRSFLLIFNLECIESLVEVWPKIDIFFLETRLFRPIDEYDEQVGREFRGMQIFLRERSSSEYSSKMSSYSIE